MMAALRYLAQMLIAGVFIFGGADAFRAPGGRVQKAADLGVPEPELAVRANGVAMVLGGAALALDVAPRAAAALLACCLIPTTVAGHAFWKESSPSGRAAHRTHFLKNAAMLGGLLYVTSSGEHSGK